MRHAATVSRIGCLFSLVALLPFDAVSSADEVRLKYLARYDHQSAEPDHLTGVEPVLDHYALVGSNRGLALIDLDVLPVGGTQDYIYRLTNLPAFNFVTRPDGYIYTNRQGGGFAVVYLDAAALDLTLIREISESGVFFEKVSLVGDRLYVPAHAYGMRIYDLTDPADPTLVGTLAEGLDDAFAVAVSGHTAYVADGAGGLKIVDITDEANPVIIAGEDPISAAATAEDVLVIDGHVYVAYGGAGVGVYDLGDIGSRTLFDTPLCAAYLAHVGDYLAVADIGGVQIFAIEPDGALTPAASESARRRSAGGEAFYTRLWHGVSAWGADRLLAAAWDSMDVYQLVDPAVDSQPDITAARQRIRFAPGGGNAVVRISNDGSGVLNISSIHSTDPAFIPQPTSAVLQPGQAFDLTIKYNGVPGDGAVVLLESDDPDEDPLPIQVFGETAYLDPGEPAIPFVLDCWTYNHDTDEFETTTFSLQAQAGKIVFLYVFGTW